MLSPSFYTAKECPPNSSPTHLMTKCEPSCANPNPKGKCTRDTQTGCVCNEGFLLSNDKCVPRSECGCFDKRRNYIPVSVAYNTRQHMTRTDYISVSVAGNTRQHMTHTNYIPVSVAGNTRQHMTRTKYIPVNLAGNTRQNMTRTNYIPVSVAGNTRQHMTRTNYTLVSVVCNTR